MTHLGSRVSALLDGRLCAAEEERCWNHVHDCHSCRDLIEREGWVKTRLAQLSFGPSSVSDRLKDSLLGQGGALTPQAFPTASGGALSSPYDAGARARHRGLLAIGGGAAGACVVGVLALGFTGGARVDPRPPVTDLTRPSAPSTTTVGDQSRRRNEGETGPTQGPASPLVEHIVQVREKMAR